MAKCEAREVFFCRDCGSTGNCFLCAPNFGHRPASDEAERLLSDAEKDRVVR